MKKPLIVISFVIIIMSVAYFAPEGTAQSTSSPTVGAKPAAPGWKNIQVLNELKAAPQNDLYNAMDFMAGSLGVSCDYCHTSSGYDSDAKRTKVKAREMIKMMRTLNESNFGGRIEVTCNTCHRGSVRPNGKPSPWNKTPEEYVAYKRLVESVTKPTKNDEGSDVPGLNTQGSWPTAEQVWATYRKAVGADAVKSFHVLGTNSVALRGAGPFEAYAVLPDQILVSSTTQGFLSKQIVNGNHGWLVSSAVTRAAMTTDQLENTRRMAEVFLPIKYANSDSPPRVVGVDKLGDRDCYVLETHSAGATLQLYFDTRSALIYKAHREVQSILGTSSSDVLFDDYRDVTGVKLPYSITGSFMANKIQYQISEIQINIDVDRAMFEPPAPKVRKEIRIDPKVFDAYAGDYKGLNRILTVKREGERYFVNQSDGTSQFEIFPETESEFFMKAVDIQITFVKNAKGEVTHLILRQNKIDQKLERIR